MARSEQALLEAETIIRFDETEGPAVMWTASPTVRQEWESYGFRPVKDGKAWRVEVPKDRLSYKPLKTRRAGESSIANANV